MIIRIVSSEFVRFLLSEVLNSLVGLEMELDIGEVSIIVNYVIGMPAVGIEGPDGRRDAAVAKKDHDGVSSFLVIVVITICQQYVSLTVRCIFELTPRTKKSQYISIIWGDLLTIVLSLALVAGFLL